MIYKVIRLQNNRNIIILKNLMMKLMKINKLILKSNQTKLSLRKNKQIKNLKVFWIVIANPNI